MRRVLLIEDDPGVRDLLLYAFTSRGWRARTAHSADTAIQAAESGEFDLIVCDVMLPQMNGLALTNQLASVQPRASVMFISGYSDLHLQQKLGAPPETLPVLQKPFHCKTLLARADHLTAPRPQPALPSFEFA